MQGVFSSKRHLSVDEDALLSFGQQVQVDWRISRLKTVGIGLLLALNIGVDPPDVFKCSPCAKLEAWIDPSLAPAAVSSENIAKALQAQYEPWQARARVRIVIKPTHEELKRLCVTLRRHARVSLLLLFFLSFRFFPLFRMIGC